VSEIYAWEDEIPSTVTLPLTDEELTALRYTPEMYSACANEQHELYLQKITAGKELVRQANQHTANYIHYILLERTARKEQETHGTVLLEGSGERVSLLSGAGKNPD